jgi:hypothetical protein
VLCAGVPSLNLVVRRSQGETAPVLSKDQAVAAADALIHRVETERRERLERSTGRLVRLYPVLKHVPAEDREALVHSAWKSPVTRWVVGVAALTAVLVALWALLGGPSLGIDPAQKRPYPLAIAAGALIAPLQYLCIRAFLRKEVPSRYRRSDKHASRSGV